MERVMMQYLPNILQEVRDFQCLMGQYQEAFMKLWDQERETEENFYLETADERGLAHWERILAITKRPGSSVQERRQIIFARQSQTTPYNWGSLLTFLTVLLGSSEAYEAKLEGFTLRIVLKPAFRGMRADVWERLRQVVPANIEIVLTVIYNMHRQIGRMTHRELESYTHRQIRSEVSINESNNTP